MNCSYYGLDLIKKNEYTRHEKQNLSCLKCRKQFSEMNEAKGISQQTKGVGYEYAMAIGFY